MNTVDELIRIYAKQLKIPSFAEYREILRQAEPSSGFPDLLLELMKTETLVWFASTSISGSIRYTFTFTSTSRTAEKFCFL